MAEIYEVHGLVQRLGKDAIVELFRKLSVEVDADGVAFAGLSQRLGNEASGIVVHALNPYAVFIDFAFDVAVGRAAHAESNGA